MGLRTQLLKALGFRRPRRRMYEGARVSRLTSDWIANGTSADAEINGSLKRLRNRSRQLVRDNDYARQAVRAVKNNVIGTGVRLQVQVPMQRGAGRLDHTVNDAIEKAWRMWGRKETCNTAGRLCFNDIERLAVAAMCESGEVFIRIVRRPFGGGNIPFALDVIEADLLDDEYTGVSTLPGNEWRMGIELDPWGRPVQYAFLTSHPGDTPFARPVADRHQLIPANEIIHLYQQERPGQTRGVPWFASAIKRMHHLSGYEEAEVVRARASSALMGFITSPEGELQGDEIYDGDRVSNFEPGVFKYLAPGESVSVPQLDAPDGQFEPFLRAMLRAMASGLGCSYETISRDFSQTNYSSSRLSLLEDRDNWRALQNYMIENFHQPVYAAWLEMAVLSGVLPLPNYESNPERYLSVRWMPRGWSWVDPAKEVDAYAAAVRNGFKTLADVVAEGGGDLQDLLRARKAELELMEEMELTFDTTTGIAEAEPAEEAAPAAPAAPEQPDPDEEDDGDEEEDDANEVE
jgi:lambda family phage portal protein